MSLKATIIIDLENSALGDTPLEISGEVGRLLVDLGHRVIGDGEVVGQDLCLYTNGAVVGRMEVDNA